MVTEPALDSSPDPVTGQPGRVPPDVADGESGGINRLSFFGLGRLGLPLAALFASSGLRTIAIDTKETLVDRLRAGIFPDAEPGVPDLLARASDCIEFTTAADGVAGTEASIILVATPSSPAEPEFSSLQVKAACRELCQAMERSSRQGRHLVIISSTVFPGTLASEIAPIFANYAERCPGLAFDLAYVPDFVALGQVVSDFANPALLLVGADDQAVGRRVAALYGRIIAPETPIRLMPTKEAEIAKIALNVFCCMKISFGNFLLQLGERMGGLDLEAIADALGLDPRIGRGLLRGGAPYGGPCFPRDVDAFLHLAESFELDASLARASASLNSAQFELIEKAVRDTSARHVAILGLSFKHGTPFITGSPGMELARRFDAGALAVAVFDDAAQARAEARGELGPNVVCADSLDEALAGAEAVVVCTADSAFADIGSRVQSFVEIIDPWGCVQGNHERVRRLGRPSPRPLGKSTRIHGVIGAQTR